MCREKDPGLGWGVGRTVCREEGVGSVFTLAVPLHLRTVYWVQRLESAEEVMWWCWFDDCSSPQELYRLVEGETIQKLFFEVQEKSLFSLVSVPDEDHMWDVDYYNIHTNQPLNLRRQESVVSLAGWGETVFLLVNNSNRSQLVFQVKQHSEVVDSDSLGTSTTFHDITILSPISQQGTCAILSHPSTPCLTRVCVSACRFPCVPVWEGRLQPRLPATEGGVRLPMPATHGAGGEREELHW